MAARGFRRLSRWFPRSSVGGFNEEDEDSGERSRLLRSHLDQIVPVTDLGDTSKALAVHVEPKTVALKVSIHCHGCARKVEKQVSKLQGVVSFKVELESKKVTVVGNVSPTDVLESICKERLRYTITLFHRFTSLSLSPPVILSPRRAVDSSLQPSSSSPSQPRIPRWRAASSPPSSRRRSCSRSPARTPPPPPSPPPPPHTTSSASGAFRAACSRPTSRATRSTPGPGTSPSTSAPAAASCCPRGATSPPSTTASRGGSMTTASRDSAASALGPSSAGGPSRGSAPTGTSSSSRSARSPPNSPRGTSTPASSAPARPTPKTARSSSRLLHDTWHHKRTSWTPGTSVFLASSAFVVIII